MTQQTSKRTVSDLALTFGLATAYQGKTRTLFVKGDGDKFLEFREELSNRFVLAQLPFVVEYSKNELPVDEPIGNPGIPAEAYIADEMGKFNADPASNVNKRLGVLDQIAEGRGYKTEESKLAGIELTQADGEKVFVPASQPKTEITKEQRALLDKFLVDNPIDRKQKGCYNAAAEKFGVGEEYVRDRYRKLRAKGLVEKDLSATPA